MQNLVLYFGTNNPHQEYRWCWKTKLVIKSEPNDTFETYFKLDKHVQNCITKANRTLGLNKQSFENMNKDMLLPLYKVHWCDHWLNMQCQTIPYTQKLIQSTRTGSKQSNTTCTRLPASPIQNLSHLVEAHRNWQSVKIFFFKRNESTKTSLTQDKGIKWIIASHWN